MPRFTDKQDYIARIKIAVRSAGLPEIPSQCLLTMDTVSLAVFYDRWILPLSFKLAVSKDSK